MKEEGENCSFLVLIPKKTNPSKISDYQPISLVGCIYKVLSKVLANRMKKVIDSLISETQSALIVGRKILDRVLVANEIIDKARKNKKEVILFKMDFEKVYHFVDWNFLTFVMEKMGFHEKWCKLIQECLRSASISVLVNGSPTKEFYMGRGLIQ